MYLLYCFISYQTILYPTIPYHSIPYRTIPDPSLPYHTIPKEQVFLCEKNHPYNTTFYPLLHKQETSISIKTPMHKCKAHVVLFKVFLCALYLFYSNFYSVLWEKKLYSYWKKPPTFSALYIYLCINHLLLRERLHTYIVFCQNILVCLGTLCVCCPSRNSSLNRHWNSSFFSFF